MSTLSQMQQHRQQKFGIMRQQQGSYGKMNFGVGSGGNTLTIATDGSDWKWEGIPLSMNWTNRAPANAV